MFKNKGGPGSGRQPGAGPRSAKPTSRPRGDRVVVPAYTAPQGPKEQSRAGNRVSDLYPNGRHADGSAVTTNDIRDGNGKPRKR